METELFWDKTAEHRKDLPLLPEVVGWESVRLNTGDKITLNFNNYYDQVVLITKVVINFYFDSCEESPFGKNMYSDQWVWISPTWRESQGKDLIQDNEFQHNYEPERDKPIEKGDTKCSS